MTGIAARLLTWLVVKVLVVLTSSMAGMVMLKATWQAG